jgi:NRPS condensation-like uncharacterized protein
MAIISYSKYRALKEKTDKEFLLTEEEFMFLTNKPFCCVSGNLLNSGTSQYENGRFTFSLDRLNAGLAYSMDNVVVMSRFFNLLKGDFTKSNFLATVELLCLYEKDITDKKGKWTITRKDLNFLLSHHELHEAKLLVPLEKYTLNDIRILADWWNSFTPRKGKSEK